VENSLVSAYDFMPTLLEYLELPVRQGQNLPGKSFLSALQGQKSQSCEPIIIFDEYGPVRMIRTERWKYVYRHACGPHELFDLGNDPDERQNLVDEPAQKDRIEELKKMMDRWFAKYVIPARDGLTQDGTQLGQTEYYPIR
jgi:choline-sulfatase